MALTKRQYKIISDVSDILIKHKTTLPETLMVLQAIESATLKELVLKHPKSIDLIAATFLTSINYMAEKAKLSIIAIKAT